MLRVVDYSRVSTEEEKQLNALKTQCDENKEFVDSRKDWMLVDRYIDEGKSATTTKGRSDFERLLADIQTDKFDVILIKQIDRGWRNTLDWKLFERELIENKKMLFVRTKNNFYNFEDNSDYMATNFEAMFSEWSSRNLSIKMNQAHKTRMKKGTVITNGKIWGYDQVNGTLVINEKEADIVRKIFDLYVQNIGFRTIMSRLSDMGIKNSNGKEFSTTTLRRIIRQEKYKGTLVCGKRHKNFFTKAYETLPESEWIVHENAVPAIVSLETWETANNILEGKRKILSVDENAKIAGYFNGSYAYSGKVVCGKCGRPYYHAKYNTMKHDLWECKGYREFGKKHSSGCDNPRIYNYELEGIIKKVIFDFMENRGANIDRIINILNEVMQGNSDESILDKQLQERGKLKCKKDKLIELFTDGLLSKEDFKNKNDEYTNLISGIDSKIQEVQAKLSSIIDKKEKLLKAKNIIGTKLNNEKELPASAVKEFLKEVIVNKENVIVKLNIDSGFELLVGREQNKKYHNVTSIGQEWSHYDILFNRDRRIKPFKYSVAVYVDLPGLTS